MCSDFAELNAEITSAHDQLIALVRKRWVMKSKINTRHDKLNRQFPAEVVSHIFNLVVKSSENPKTRPQTQDRVWVHAPVVLGVVCKRWRDIALGTPQLWTLLSINLRASPDSTSLDLMKEWLRRSGTVPLSLTLYSNVRQGAQPPTYLPVIDLLRSHSGRWNHVKICGPWRILYELFNNLEHIPPIATFEAKPRDVRSESEHIDMLEPICPKEFTSRIFPLEKMPLQWNNLTLLNAKMMCMDVLHIISNANGLLDCTVKNMLDSSGKYPLPTKPIVHHGLNRFKISRTYSNFTSNVFPYLVLPSPDTLDYGFVCDPEAFDLLVSFLDRSRPSLQTFTFTYSFEFVFSSWYERMPKITHLDIHCSDYHGIFPMTEELFKALARSIGHPVLPHLRKLLISINRIPNFFWPLLCDIFRDTQEGPEISEDDVGAAITPVDGMSTDDTDAIISPFTSPPTPRLYRRRRPLDQICIRSSVGTNLNLMMDDFHSEHCSEYPAIRNITRSCGFGWKGHVGQRI